MKAKRFPKLDLPSDYEAYLREENYVPVSEAVVEEPEADPDDFESSVSRIVTLIMSQNPLREVLYKTLKHASEERDFTEVEEFIASQDEYVHSHIIQTPYSLITMLVDNGGLALAPYGSNGEALTNEQAEGLSEDEIDDLIEGHTVRTTPPGEAAVGLLAPSVRIRSQIDQRPHRRETYLALLDFCRTPRRLPEIEEFFKDNEALAVDVVANHHRLSPDFYVDKLDKAGALVWRGAWVTTEEGETFLAQEQSSPNEE